MEPAKKPEGVEVSEDMLEFIGLRVWSGLYDREDLLRISVEALEDEVFEDNLDSLDEDSLSEIISNAFDEKEKAEKSWPEQTDCDRLRDAFRELTLGGIVSIENAGYTQSEGWEDFWEVINDNWDKEDVRGGCFYHGQDLERAVTGFPLYLAFGATRDGADVAIGQEIVEVLKKHGFKPEWNSTKDGRISIELNWQRRFGPTADPTPAELANA